MGLKPSYTWHDGFAMPLGFPRESFGSALEYAPEPSDFFVATYPKCGTTWAQHIVYLIAHRGVPLPPTNTMGDAIPHLEEVGARAVSRHAPPRYLKTHLPFGMTPYHEHARYLYVARNPFDCAVSFYHHTRGFVRHYDFAEGRFEDFFECFLAGEVDFGDYFDNLLSWHEHAEDDNVLFLTYEEMSADPADAVVRIARFMGADCIYDKSVLTAILEHSSFDSMSKDQQRWSSRRPDDMPAFVRKGIVGDWENYFLPSQAARLLEKLERRCRGTGIEGLWPDIIGEARRFARNTQ